MLMFSLKKMVPRKKTIDNSVRYIPKSEQTRDKDKKPNKIKNKSLLANKVKVFHKTMKNSLKT